MTKGTLSGLVIRQWATGLTAWRPGRKLDMTNLDRVVYVLSLFPNSWHTAGEIMEWWLPEYEAGMSFPDASLRQLVKDGRVEVRLRKGHLKEYKWKS